VSGVQQSVDHVEDEQRLHSLVGKAFPSFGEGEIGKTARMPDKAAILRLMHRRRVFQLSVALGVRRIVPELGKQEGRADW
jgi:hypothetical protein